MQDIAEQARKWRSDIGPQDGYPGIVDGNGKQVLAIMVDGDSYIDGQWGDRDANEAKRLEAADAISSFVATACRSHAELRAALWRAIEYFDTNGGDESYTWLPWMKDALAGAQAPATADLPTQQIRRGVSADTPEATMARYNISGDEWDDLSPKIRRVLCEASADMTMQGV